MVFKKGDPNIYRRKKKEVSGHETPVSIGTNGTATLDVSASSPLQQRRFDLVLGVRRVRSGNFSGLWELCELSNNRDYGIEIVMTDANVKQILLAKIGRRLNDCF